MKTIIGIALGVVLAFIIFVLIKNENTYRNHTKITNAIYCHNVINISDGQCDNVIDYSVKEKYDKTMKRWWDFSYTRIVPEDILKRIEPYIGLDPETVSYEIKYKLEHSIDLNDI